jgi:hypothetical protein
VTTTPPAELPAVEDVRRQTPRRWSLLAADGARQGSSLVTIAAVAILALTLYLVLPGGERARQAPPETGPPPVWEQMPGAANWRDPTAESPRPGEVALPPQEDQTVITPSDEAITVADERLSAAPPWRTDRADPQIGGQVQTRLAEFDGTIEHSTLHRARRESGDESLH